MAMRRATSGCTIIGVISIIMIIVSTGPSPAVAMEASGGAGSSSSSSSGADGEKKSDADKDEQEGGDDAAHDTSGSAGRRTGLFADLSPRIRTTSIMDDFSSDEDSTRKKEEKTPGLPAAGQSPSQQSTNSTSCQSCFPDPVRRMRIVGAPTVEALTRAMEILSAELERLQGVPLGPRLLGVPVGGESPSWWGCQSLYLGVQESPPKAPICCGGYCVVVKLDERLDCPPGWTMGAAPTIAEEEELPAMPETPPGYREKRDRAIERAQEAALTNGDPFAVVP